MIHRFQIINADNEIVRFFTVSGSYEQAKEAVSKKLKFAYGDKSVFLKSEHVSEHYYNQVRPMFEKGGDIK